MLALRRLLPVVLAAALPLASIAQEAAPKPPPPPVVSFYGILQGAFFWNGGTFNAQDAAYQGLRTNTGGAFYASARQTRAGMKLNLGDDNALGAAVTGTLEFDFMGPTTATNSSGAYNPGVRLRHAWMMSSWKTGAGDVSLVIGQDWDFMLNLNPESVAYLANPMFGQSGNLFRRAPQIRLNWFNNFGGDFGLGVQVAVMSPVDTNTTKVDLGTGNLARSPNYLGRAYVSMKGDFGGTIGVAYETENRRITYVAATGTKKDVATSLIGIDADLNLSQYLGVKGEYYMDKGMADSTAGLVWGGGSNNAPNGTGLSATLNLATGDVVESSGYWAQAVLKPMPLIWLTVGMGQAEVDTATLDTANGAAAIGAGDRTKNSSTSVGLILNLAKYWRLGLDYYMTTSTYGNGANENKVDIQQIAFASQLRF